MTIVVLFFLSFIISCSPCSAAEQAQPELSLESITLPPGFTISIYASGVENARSMALGDKGTLFVGTRLAGKVYAIPDADRNNAGDKVVVIASNLPMPNGVAFRNGALYVAAMTTVFRFDDIEQRLDDPPAPVTVSSAFPADRWHGWKFIRFGPDGLLYVPIGAPCNVCESPQPRFATIMRMKPDGTGLEIFARGVRCSMGFDWDPQTGEFWFTDNGRDWLGDDLPQDELNHAPRRGMHFGFPYRHGADTVDPEYGAKHPEIDFTPPALELGAHVAALGMRFYTGAMFPEYYRNQIFIAEHGSWNRSVPVGYRVVLVRREAGKPPKEEVFAQGWLKEGQRPWGRPVDVLVMPDGALLVSDDKAGVIYRISYAPSAAAAVK